MTAPDRALFSPAHAAEYLDVSRQTIIRLTHTGDLLAVRVRGITRYARKDLDAFIERLRKAS